MAALNQLFIIGNVGRDPETRQTATGKSVTSFSVAVSRKVGGKDSTDKNTQWFSVSCWDKLSEFVSQYVSKGRLVAVTGPVELNRYQGQDGQEKCGMQITARECQLLGSRSEETQQATAQGDLATGGMPF